VLVSENLRLNFFKFQNLKFGYFFSSKNFHENLTISYVHSRPFFCDNMCKCCSAIFVVVYVAYFTRQFGSFLVLARVKWSDTLKAIDAAELFFYLFGFDIVH